MPEFINEQSNSNLRPQTKQEFKKSPDSVGAVWIKTNDNGIEYLSMKLEIDGETLNLKAFLNSAKSDGDLRPEYIVYKSKNIKKEINGNK